MLRYMVKRDFANVNILRLFEWEFILDYVGRSKVITIVIVRRRQEYQSEEEIRDDEEEVGKIQEVATSHGMQAVSRC